MSPIKRQLLRVWKTGQDVLAKALSGFPGKAIRVIGVTGTDGKTTTVHLIAAALSSAGYTVGALSTIHVQVGTRVETNTSKLTTPGPWRLARLLAHMVRAGCHYAVLECSSHRLDQGGLWGAPFDVAVITNVSREHFDYHANFEEYVAAKRRLFRGLRHRSKVLPFRRGIDQGGRVPTVAVVNLDDPRVVGFLSEPAEQKYGFTLQTGEQGVALLEAQSVADQELIAVSAYARVEDHERSRTAGSLRFPLQQCIVRAGAHEAVLRLRLPGEANLSNALAAVAVGVSQGIELARITRELSEVTRIPGRMDVVENGQPFTVIIDYAVTPAAFEALYKEVQSSKSKVQGSRIIHVFGAAGERDCGKRPLLGEIAGKNADLVILADEDPYGEDPEQILDDLERGMSKSDLVHQGRTLTRIRDRRLAIREAFSQARPGDIVLVTGKGAEETIAVGSRRIPWNDRRVIEEELAALGYR